MPDWNFLRQKLFFTKKFGQTFNKHQYFHIIFCTRRCWRRHKFQSKVPFISNNFMKKFLDFHILGAFLHKCFSVAIHSKVTIHSFTQVNFFIIYMQFSTNEIFQLKYLVLYPIGIHCFWSYREVMMV